jgi:hypothetical protein
MKFAGVLGRPKLTGVDHVTPLEGKGALRTDGWARFTGRFVVGRIVRQFLHSPLFVECNGDGHGASLWLIDANWMLAVP